MNGKGKHIPHKTKHPNPSESKSTLEDDGIGGLWSCQGGGFSLEIHTDIPASMKKQIMAKMIRNDDGTLKDAYFELGKPGILQLFFFSRELIRGDVNESKYVLEIRESDLEKFKKFYKIAELPVIPQRAQIPQKQPAL